MVPVLVLPIMHQMRKKKSKITTIINGYATRLHYQKTKRIIFVHNSIHSKKTAFQIGDFPMKKMKNTDVQNHRKTKFQHYLDQHHFR